MPRFYSIGAIAQLVEHRTENPGVPGSIPGGTTANPRKPPTDKVSGGFDFSSTPPTDKVSGGFDFSSTPPYDHVSAGGSSLMLVDLLTHSYFVAGLALLG